MLSGLYNGTVFGPLPLGPMLCLPLPLEISRFIIEPEDDIILVECAGKRFLSLSDKNGWYLLPNREFLCSKNGPVIVLGDESDVDDEEMVLQGRTMA